MWLKIFLGQDFVTFQYLLDKQLRRKLSGYSVSRDKHNLTIALCVLYFDWLLGVVCEKISRGQSHKNTVVVTYQVKYE